MNVIVRVWIVSLAFATGVMAQNATARPGKGLIFVPGDFVEYSNTLHQGGKKTVLPSTIMVAMGKHKKMDAVMVISVRDDKVVSKSCVLYDTTLERTKMGKLLGSGKETLTIQGKKYACTWEKRRRGDVTGTFWICPNVPFETYAKILMESDSGQKMVTELVFHGPDTKNPKQGQEFRKRLQKLMGEE